MHVDTLQGTPEGASDEILSDHEGLRGILLELEQHLRQPIDLQGCWLMDLREVLRSLVETCRAHFKAEEEAELHMRLLEHSPRLGFRLQRLLADHPMILEGLQRLFRELQAVEAFRPDDLHSLRERVQCALEAVHRHERDENEIIMDAYWDDLGGEG